MKRKYNFIYSKLVATENDLVGLIAYGIYKKHKIEFIDTIKETEQRDPTDEECQSFFAASTTDSQLYHYRHQAETILSETVGNIAKEEILSYEADMLKNYRKEIKSCLPSNNKTIVIGIISGIVSAFLFSLLAACFYIMGWTSERTIRENTEQIIEYVVETPTDSIKVIE